MEAEFNKTAIQIFLSINFSERFKMLSEKYNDFENRLNKVDKKEVQTILSKLNYTFKYTEGHFVLKETFDDDYIHLALSLKGGVFSPRLTIFQDRAFWKISSGNFVSIYRSLKQNINAQIMMPIFSTYEEFEQIAKEVLGIYEDFKQEFISLIERKV